MLRLAEDKGRSVEVNVVTLNVGIMICKRKSLADLISAEKGC